jgi:acetylornithine deacetylase/succinyl-diaminopimelate desuccinylase-like protein
MNSIQEYLHQNKSRFETELFDWLKIPSIGTDPDYDSQTREAGLWLAEKFRQLGLETEVIETWRHPLIYAQSPPVPGKPVALVYGHYDVQPPDPLDLWDSPPFEPTVRDGKVFARGATDDKGQMITHLFGVEAFLKQVGPLPIQVKFLIEGEEESGGRGLTEFLQGSHDHQLPVKERLAADIAIISDCSQYGPGQPAITYGLRGNTYFQLDLVGPNRDLHSGGFGGMVTNPANALSQMMAALIDKNGRIQVPGFYDQVRELTAEEKTEFLKLNFSEAELRQDLGVDQLVGEAGYSTLERGWTRPTFDINGMWSGYQGKGAKTVLPSEAGAKFSFRLVPDQDPELIIANVRKMLESICPPGIKMKLNAMHGAPGFVLPLDSPYMGAASRAIETGFGTPPLFIRSGGTIPVVSQFSTYLGIQTLLLGWGQNDDNLHSPNEKFSLEDFHRGISSSSALWSELGKLTV